MRERPHVHQALSSLFDVTLTVVSENPDIDFESVAGKEASFTMHLFGGPQTPGAAAPRTWTGLAAELHQIRVQPHGLSTYLLRIVPTLWLTTQRRNHRIFQMKTELEIVVQLLTEWGIEHELLISGKYKTRKYRVQYGESDYVFLSRMLEDAGITFYFEDSKLVLSDAPQTNELRVPPVAFHDTPMDAFDREHVTAVRIGRRRAAGQVHDAATSTTAAPPPTSSRAARPRPAGVEEKPSSASTTRPARSSSRATGGTRPPWPTTAAATAPTRAKRRSSPRSALAARRAGRPHLRVRHQRARPRARRGDERASTTSGTGRSPTASATS